MNIKNKVLVYFYQLFAAFGIATIFIVLCEKIAQVFKDYLDITSLLIYLFITLAISLLGTTLIFSLLCRLHIWIRRAIAIGYSIVTCIMCSNIYISKIMQKEYDVGQSILTIVVFIVIFSVIGFLIADKLEKKHYQKLNQSLSNYRDHQNDS